MTYSPGGREYRLLTSLSFVKELVMACALVVSKNLLSKRVLLSFMSSGTYKNKAPFQWYCVLTIQAGKNDMLKATLSTLETSRKS